MLSIVWPRKKLPVEILESLALLLRGKEGFHMEVGERQEMTGILCRLFENKLVASLSTAKQEEEKIEIGSEDYRLNNP